MKKTYISPEATMVNVNVEGVIAGSPTLNDSTPTNDDPNNGFSNEYRSSLWGE